MNRKNKDLHLVVIDDDPVDLELFLRYVRDIQDWNTYPYLFTTTKLAIEHLQSNPADLIFVDYHLGAETGLDVFNALRENGFLQPAIMLTGQGNELVAVKAMKSGIADYLVKDYLSAEELRKSISNTLEKEALRRQVEEQREKLERMAQTDHLTGLMNRGSFMERFSQELERSSRYNLPLSLLMLDLDHFKSVNDTYGHLVGDRVLIETSRIIRENLRSTDIAGRFGGEEFIVLLTNTECKGAVQFSERIREKIAEFQFDEDGCESLSVTCSIGVICVPDNMKTPSAALQSVDRALYQSKNSGRNRVTCFNNVN